MEGLLALTTHLRYALERFFLFQQLSKQNEVNKEIRKRTYRWQIVLAERPVFDQLHCECLGHLLNKTKQSKKF